MKKKLRQKPQSATGKLRVHPRGFGFLIPDDRASYPEDIFIPRHLVGGAVDGDLVEVEVASTLSEKGPEGKVSHVLRRSRSHVAGTITDLLGNGEALAYVPLIGTKEPMRLMAPEDRLFQVGDRVVIHVKNWGSKQDEPVGEMASVIGHISDSSKDVLASIEEYDLDDAFPPAVRDEVKQFGKHVSTKDLASREDLRHLTAVTIDPDTAKDFDDAISLTQDKKGHFHLGVHIADVSHYVRPNTALDQEAKIRCNSVYFPGFVLPMLPHELSSHLCSLKPHVNRLAVSVLVELDPEGHVVTSRITKSVIKSAHRFSYKQAKAVLDGANTKNPHAHLLFTMADLCHRLKKRRFERGSIEFSLPDIALKVGADGAPLGVELVEYDITHQMIEEFMLKANEIVATRLSLEGKPLTYRIHEEPNADNLKNFVALANSFGFNLPDTPTSSHLQMLFDEARGRPFGQFLATQFIRNQKLASYSVQNMGHYGLMLEHYCHFTSPIRRYIDLIVHRVLFNHLSFDEDLEEVALRCSEKERLSAKAENSVTRLKKLRLLLKEQKKERYRRYSAVITQVKPFGFAFEVEAFLLDGFIHVSEMGSDFFTFEGSKNALLGRRSRTCYTSGDKIEVLLKHVNLIIQEASWSLCSPASKN